VNPAASRALEAVCRKAMARQPANRYAGAAELATDVQRWLADEPVLALREPWPDRAARWARRHRPAVAATATTVLTVVVALSVSTALLWTEERKTAAQKVAADEQRDRADEQAKTAQKQQGRAEANLDTAHALTLKLVYATEKLLPPVNGSEMARLELSRAAAGAFRSFSEQRPETPEARRTNAELSRIEANLCRLVGDADGAEKAYASAIEALRGDEVSELRFAETLRDYAYLQHITGRPVAALATLQKAQVVVDQLRKREPGRNAFKRVAATVYLDRAYAETTVGRYPDALASCDLAIALYRELLTLDTNPLDYESTLFLAASLTQKAMAARESHNWPGAATLLTEAKATLKPLIGPGRKFPSVNADDALFWQAMSVYEECRNRAESGDYKTPAPEKNLETVVLRFTDLSTRHSRIPHYRGWLGKSLLALGRAREARAKSAEAAQDYQADYQAALLHFERLVKDCPAFPEYQADLGRACLGQAQATAADPAAARAWHDRGTAALRAALAASPDDAEIKRDIAGLMRPADR
jgi:tetratricopeptide (TPR) repeat protein